jgi:hypothetical protein
MKRPRPRHGLAAVSVLVVGGVLAAPSYAQAQAGPAGAGAIPAGQPPTATPGSTYVPVTPSTPSTPSTQVGSYGNPQSPSGTIGGGNATESSAHPITGDEEDSFDLGARRGAGGAVRGDNNGPVFVGTGGLTYAGGEPPGSHLVRRGDTLWGICGFYFQNPYQWPRIWSYNPQIKNPHWIYPGDEVRLKEGGGVAAGGAGGGPEAATAPGPSPVPSTGPGMTLTDRRRKVPSGTVFLRDQGWISDPSDEVWGDVTGSAQDKMFLTDLDEIYLHIEPGHDVHLGQELTVFRPMRVSRAGTLVQISGTAKVDHWNAQDRIARAQVTESLNPIERGAKVGPLARRFDVVAPRRNDVEVQAHILASIYPNAFWGQSQVVFIDKGMDAGLKPGNRLFVIRRGDAWRKTLITPTAAYRVSADDESPMPPMEKTPGSHKDEENYPDEVIGELRVVALRKDTATCLVTQSRSEIEPNELAVARKGY